MILQIVLYCTSTGSWEVSCPHLRIIIYARYVRKKNDREELLCQGRPGQSRAGQDRTGQTALLPDTTRKKKEATARNLGRKEGQTVRAKWEKFRILLGDFQKCPGYWRQLANFEGKLNKFIYNMTKLLFSFILFLSFLKKKK